jgi:phage host-nuclease inhibitor protein Gam
MAKRKKPLNVFPIKSMNDANDALGEIAKQQRILADIETKMNDDIDAIKATATAKATVHEKKLQGFENGLQAFSEYSKDDLFQNKKSIELSFGTIGFRKASKLKPMTKNTWARVLEILKEKGLKSAIRVKESPNKEILGEWSEEKLSTVNVQRKTVDQFWYEVKEEDLKVGGE